MARLDVYPNLNGKGLLLDVQAELLDGLNTRVVVPLLSPLEAPLPAHRLNPRLLVNDEPYLCVTQFLAAIPASMLKEPITNLSAYHDDITLALDMVFQGF